MLNVQSVYTNKELTTSSAEPQGVLMSISMAC